MSTPLQRRPRTFSRLFIAVLVILIPSVHAGDDPFQGTPSIAAGEAGSPPVSSRESTRKAKLRYKGKSFDELREQFLTEIGPEARQENLKGLGFFARHGFAAETVTAILEMAREYDDFFAASGILEKDQFTESLALLKKSLQPPEENKGFTEEQADIKVMVDCYEIIKTTGRAGLPALREGLKGDHVGVHCFVAEVLADMGPSAHEAIPELLGLIKSKSPISRAIALTALAHVGEKDPKILEMFLAILKDGDPATRTAGRSGLVRSPLAKQTVPAIIKALNDKNAEVCEAAIGALETAEAGAQAVPALIKVLQRKDVKFELVYEHLRTLGPQAKEAVPVLLANLERAAKNNKTWMFPVFEEMPGNKVRKRFVERFDFDDEYLSIVDTLGAIGPAAAEAAPALKKLLAAVEPSPIPAVVPSDLVPAPIVPVMAPVVIVPAATAPLPGPERIRRALAAIQSPQSKEKKSRSEQ